MDDVTRLGDGHASAKPAVEIYTKERRAEFLLTNAVDSADFAKAESEVRAMGLDPEVIMHGKPKT
ncbi:MAG TPA: hypothetical protein VFI91_02930 [Longimicrobiaceae bacterium]|nr:hypothetical protein [Longimicrobiaceae bacterium]